MANPSILPRDMTLYSPAEPKGRLFLQGDQWPGDAWSERPGGQELGKATAGQALKDLAEAQSRHEDLVLQLESASHDRAQLEGELSAARTRIAELEQAAADAAATGNTSFQEAQEAVAARDQAIAQASEYHQRAEELLAVTEQQKEAIERIAGELSAAQQAAADAKAPFEGRIQELETDLANAQAKASEAEGLLGLANEEIAALKAEIAKVDPDKDGKVGGSTKKSAT